MSAYGFHKSTLETTHKGEVRYPGSFVPNGSSAPEASGIRGNWISSVVHTGTGIWTITMATPYKNVVGLLSAIATLSLASSGLSFVQIGAIDLTAGTIVIRAYTEATGTLALADIDNTAGNRISFEFVFKYANIPDGAGV